MWFPLVSRAPAIRLPGRFLLLLALGTGFLPRPVAAQRLYRVELGAAGAYQTFDSQTDLAATVGLAGRLGYWFYGPLSLELEGSWARPHTDTPLRQKVTTSSVAGWLLANFRLGGSGSLFLKGGYGSVGYGKCPAVSIPGSGPCGSAGVIQGGVGFRLGLTPTLLLRYDATVNRSLTTLKFSNVALQAGLSLMLGSQPLVDSDGDRVFDPYDKCPGTPLGALVDKHGCPTDQDGDGVPDGLDRCPGTPAGAAVDPAGCTQDSDGDGVLDGLDQCPDTPAGAVVDPQGCPMDTDGDGVPDGLDRCPGTPAGATVDALGCPGDTDGDGVFDGLDRCPDTRRGVPVDATGCPSEVPGRAPEDTGRVWVLPGSVWEFRGAVLDSAAYPMLNSIARLLKGTPGLHAEVNGFAFDRLVPADNTRLSQLRAEAVRAYLISQGAPVSQVTAIGRGSEPLLDTADTEEARTANRRVEIRITSSP